MKAEVMQSLVERHRAAAVAPSNELSLALSDLRKQRDTLRRYVSLLRRPIGELGRPVNALYWRFLSLHEELAQSIPLSLGRDAVAAAEQISQLDLNGQRDALDAVERTATQIQESHGSLRRSPWHAARNLKPTSFHQQEARELLNRIIVAIDRLGVVGGDLSAQTGVNAPSSEAAADVWLRALARLPENASEVCQSRLRAALRAPEGTRTLVQRLQRYREYFGQAAIVHPAPLAVDLDAVIALDGVLRALGTEATSAAELRRQHAVAIEFRTNLARLDAQLRPACVQVNVDLDSTSAYALRVLVAVFGRLRDAPAEGLRLRKPSLLDDDAAACLAAGQTRATVLREREAALSARIDLAAAETLGAEQLDALTAILSEAGAFTRLFGSIYKNSLRSARALCTKEATERAAIVDALRTAAQWLREIAEFRDNAALAGLFGAAWDAHRSDFTQLETTRALLERLAGLLLPVGMNECLELVTGAPTPTLQALTARAQLDTESNQLLAGIDSDVTLPQILVAAERRKALLAKAVTAAAVAGVTADGLLRTGELSTVEVFRTLHALQSELSTPPDASDLWHWYSGAEEDPHTLAAAVSMADAIAAAQLPEDVIARVSEVPEPGVLVARLRKGEQAVREHLQAIRDAWRTFSEAVSTDPSAFLGVENAGVLPWSQVRAVVAEAHGDTNALTWFADLQTSLIGAEQRGVRFVYEDLTRHGNADPPSGGCLRILADPDTAQNIPCDTRWQRPPLASGRRSDQARHRFRALDGEAMASEARRRVRRETGRSIAAEYRLGPKIDVDRVRPDPQ